jgi:hypothetical protein
MHTTFYLKNVKAENHLVDPGDIGGLDSTGSEEGPGTVRCEHINERRNSIKGWVLLE